MATAGRPVRYVDIRLPFLQLPELTPLNEFFWTSGADGQLRFLRCACGYYLHPPTPRCPRCEGTQIEPTVVGGGATVVTYTVNQQPWSPGLEPYVLAIVELDEQPGLRLTTQLHGCGPDEVSIGQRVSVVFAPVEDVFLPLFEPVVA